MLITLILTCESHWWTSHISLVGLANITSESKLFGGRGGGRMAHQRRWLFAPTGNISWGVHSLSDPHRLSFHGSSCMVTDSASLAGIPVCYESESTCFISVWQFKLKIVLEHARRVSFVWICDDTSCSIVCLAYDVGMISHCDWRTDWSTTADYQPVRKMGSSLMRPSAVRSGSRQEVTNDMVQIS